jgi:hypothetical protein
MTNEDRNLLIHAALVDAVWKGLLPADFDVDGVLAALARDADVRTLDAWASAAEWRYYETRPWGVHTRQRCVLCEDPGSEVRPRAFDGATPDEARAKAAAWIREQGQ